MIDAFVTQVIVVEFLTHFIKIVQWNEDVLDIRE
jgi:hypothetical protein